MAGLELITDKIISEAVAEAEKKKADAASCAENIRAEYRAEEQRLATETEEKLAEIERESERNADSAVKAKEREAILAVENETVREIISEAKKRISELPRDEYFAFLTEIYKNNAENAEGEIILCAEDKENMLVDFLDKLSGICGKVSLSEEDLGKKGFVVRYGRVELNCSFDAIFEDKYNLFSDIASECCKG